MTKEPGQTEEKPDSSRELSTDELKEISGGIGGSNGVARSGSGGVTPPPTAPPEFPG